ncbi:hypothetical protein PN36_03860 [Candidatus Thiomargarita nelsonii]|uniref:Uncharacterized protein n=1 Tax=Candidatus Thiomargarita nelsonii TaxID=1003181 RepID=A0A4E0QWB7_9GAMM|nr:hypothetical protein PN36_03860 [Candidatus Thiomargarita nelsonii]
MRKRTVGATQAKYALLNEDQAVFALTLSRNTPQVVQLKLDLTRAFRDARHQTKAKVEPQSFFSNTRIQRFIVGWVERNPPLL